MFRALDFLARVLAMKVGIMFGARSGFGKAAEAHQVGEHQTECNCALHEQIYLLLFCRDSLRSSETQALTGCPPHGLSSAVNRTSAAFFIRAEFC